MLASRVVRQAVGLPQARCFSTAAVKLGAGKGADDGEKPPANWRRSSRHLYNKANKAMFGRSLTKWEKKKVGKRLAEESEGLEDRDQDQAGYWVSRMKEVKAEGESRRRLDLKPTAHDVAVEGALRTVTEPKGGRVKKVVRKVEVPMNPSLHEATVFGAINAVTSLEGAPEKPKGQSSADPGSNRSTSKAEERKVSSSASPAKLFRSIVIPEDVADAPYDVFNPSRAAPSPSSSSGQPPLESFRERSTSGLPSVSHILKATMPASSRLRLERWMQRMKAELGEEAFAAMQEQTLSRGNFLHGHIESVLLEREAEEADDEVSRRHLESVAAVLGDFSRPAALESRVEHADLGYCGILDCLAEYRGEGLALVDWKTTERRKEKLEDTFDNPVQLAAYVGAVNHDLYYASRGEVSLGLLVLVHNDGSPARVLRMGRGELERYWDEWRDRLDEYRRMQVYEQRNGR